ncbi:MAG: hypothetical protein R2788_07975 [Saprospiraceae bacterium]
MVTFERSKQMLDIMDDPALHHKFVNTLDRIAPMPKDFTTKIWFLERLSFRLCFGVGKDPNTRYILVALTQGSSWRNHHPQFGRASGKSPKIKA